MPASARRCPARLRPLPGVAVTISALAAGGCASPARDLVRPLPAPPPLRELIASGFAGPISGCPETASGGTGTRHGPFWADDRSFPSTDVLPHHVGLWEARAAAQEDGVLGPQRDDLRDAFYGVVLRTDHGSTEWRVTLRYDGFRQGDVEDLEVLYAARDRSSTSWAPWLALIGTSTTWTATLERRGVLARPRRREGASLEDQLAALDVTGTIARWVHPKLGMIYEVVEPRPARPTYLFVTSPKHGPPLLDAVLDAGAAGVLREHHGFIDYEALCRAALPALNDAAQAAALARYEPFLVCDVLSQPIRERLAVQVARARAAANVVGIEAALAVLDDVQDPYLQLPVLADAHAAALAQGVLPDAQQATLARHADKALERLRADLAAATEAKQFATAAGLAALQGALLGVTYEPLSAERDDGSSEVRSQPGRVAEAQNHLISAIKRFPQARGNGAPYGFRSADLLAEAPGGGLLQVYCSLGPSGRHGREWWISSEAPEWQFEIDRESTEIPALSVRTESGKEPITWRELTDVGRAWRREVDAMYSEAARLEKAIPMIGGAETVTRDEWVRLVYATGTSWGVRPVTRTIVTEPRPDTSSGQWRAWQDARNRAYQVAKKEPEGAYVTRSATVPVSYQIWSVEGARSPGAVTAYGEVLERFSFSCDVGRRFTRFLGNERPSQWKTPEEMERIVAEASRIGAVQQLGRQAWLFHFRHLERYLRELRPGWTDEQHAVEAAWLRYWFGQPLSDLERARLPMAALERLEADPRALELSAIAALLTDRGSGWRGGLRLPQEAPELGFEPPPLEAAEAPRAEGPATQAR